MSLRAKTVAGTFWSAMAQVLNQALTFFVGVLLARMLGPEQFGLIGMITVVTGFMQVFGRMGIGPAIIQHKDITKTDLASAFWLNVFLGTALMLGLICAAPVLSAFFQEPALVGLSRMISLNFLLSATGVVPVALIMRNLNFRKLAYVEICASGVSGLLAVLAAVGGLGVWSLVIKSLAASATRTGAAFVVCKWFPQATFSWQAIKRLLPFSANLTCAEAINYWVRNADNLLIAKFIGTEALGIYSRAYSLMLTPIRQVSSVVTRVMFPALSTIRHDLPRIKSAYLRSLRAIAFFSFPASLGLMAASDYFVIALLGEKWSAVIPILRVLCVLSMTQSLGSTTGIIYQATGRTDVQFRWTVYSSIIVISAFLVGIKWGPFGVATAYVLATLCCLSYPSVVVSGSLIGLRFSEYTRNVRSIFLCSALMGICVFLTGRLLKPFVSPELGLLILVLVGILTYSAAVIGSRLAVLDDLFSMVPDRFQPAWLAGLIVKSDHRQLETKADH